MKLHPPWTDSQVRRLNEWQMCEWAHPFTCAQRGDEAHRRHSHLLNERDHGILIATNDGWRCPVCSYRQTWAHDFMFDGAPPDPRAQLRSKPR